jgi:hypothetical protein
MHPVIAPAKPGAACVITAPIIADTECHDADAEPRAVFNDGHPTALVVVVQVIAVHPTAIAFPIDIAPSPVVDATVQIQQSVARDGGYQRIVGTWSGPKMHAALGVGIGGPRDRSISDRGEHREHEAQTFHENTYDKPKNPWLHKFEPIALLLQRRSLQAVFLRRPCNRVTRSASLRLRPNCSVSLPGSVPRRAESIA